MKEAGKLKDIPAFFIMAVCFDMGKDTITDWRTILIAVLSIIIAFTYKRINSAFIVSLFGYLLALL